MLLSLYLSPSPFSLSGGVLRFDPDESSHMVYVHIVEDSEPELDELFRVELSEPTGGARVGSRGVIDVVIATNDNAHGIIGFAEVQFK